MVKLGENVIKSDIAEFYSGKSVFITGGTGFLGKILIEKLLYCCKNIEKIYVLIRKKKDISPQKRVEQMMENAVFTRLKEEDPDSLKKIVPIIGDLSEPNLGINDRNKNILIKKVSVVMHVGATIRFNENIRQALRVNVEGTRQILNLCHLLENRDALVHVSTAYSNTEQRLVEERIYPPPADLEDVYNFIEENGDSDEEATKLLNGKPNTYTFTKALAESLVEKNRGDIPTAVVRPSIVTCTDKEPVAGWIDNWNGATSILYAASHGVHRFMLGGRSLVGDIVPVDIVTNMIIVAAARLQGSQHLKVYNCVSGNRNPITNGEVINKFVEAGASHGFNDLPYPKLFMINSKIIVNILQFIFLAIPAFFADLYRKMLGRPPKYTKMLSLVKKAEDVLSYFTTHEWLYRDDNVQDLIASMSPEDKELFYFDVAAISWDKYMDKYVLGVYRYMLKRDITMTTQNQSMQ